MAGGNGTFICARQCPPTLLSAPKCVCVCVCVCACLHMRTWSGECVCRDAVTYGVLLYALVSVSLWVTVIQWCGVCKSFPLKLSAVGLTLAQQFTHLSWGEEQATLRIMKPSVKDSLCMCVCVCVCVCERERNKESWERLCKQETEEDY